ncbi:MAG: glycosyltransferase family 4 protein [Armatimonadota bacterium]|nr:MAG: glycosyltransferase family 4 protein [Armatimonadota bacterium]
MRVLMFTTDYLPNVGGVATHVFELAGAIREAGHEVLVVTNVPGSEDDGGNGTPPVLRVSEHVRGIPVARGRRLQFLINMARPMIKDLRHYDLVHFHTVDALSRALCSIWRGPPMVATNHTSMFVADAGQPHRALRWRRFFEHMHGIIAPSKELADLTIALGCGAQKVRYIPNGVDARTFHPGVPGVLCRDSHGIGPHEPLLLCPRRLVEKNGCVYLARAMGEIVRQIPSARVLFAGDGPESAPIEQALRAAGCLDRAVFAQSVPNAEMPAYYAAADVVVVPSLVEATSISVLEAMATARPVVATRVGGLPALVEHGRTGYLVRPRDEGELASRICDLLADGERRARLGESARQRVLESFTWNRVAELTVDAYRTFGGCRKPRAA